MCNKNLRLNSPLKSQQTIRVYWSTLLLTLPFFEEEGGGGGGGSDTYLKFDF